MQKKEIDPITANDLEKQFILSECQLDIKMVAVSMNLPFKELRSIAIRDGWLEKRQAYRRGNNILAFEEDKAFPSLERVYNYIDRRRPEMTLQLFALSMNTLDIYNKYVMECGAGFRKVSGIELLNITKSIAALRELLGELGKEAELFQRKIIPNGGTQSQIDPAIHEEFKNGLMRYIPHQEVIYETE